MGAGLDPVERAEAQMGAISRRTPNIDIVGGTDMDAVLSSVF